MNDLVSALVKSLLNMEGSGDDAVPGAHGTTTQPSPARYSHHSPQKVQLSVTDRRRIQIRQGGMITSGIQQWKKEKM